MTRRAVAAMLCVPLVLVGIMSSWPAHADDERIAGKFLVATPRMPDPRFQKTVIFMARHDGDGAMGVVINKPLANTTLRDLLEQLGLGAPGATRDKPVHYGGPVQPGTGLVLHSADYQDPSTQKITTFAAMTGSRSILKAMAGGRGPDRWLFTLGYAGWGPGQLERELLREDWYVVPADATLLFGENNADKWKEAVARWGVEL